LNKKTQNERDGALLLYFVQAMDFAIDSKEALLKKMREVKHHPQFSEKIAGKYGLNPLH